MADLSFTEAQVRNASPASMNPVVINLLAGVAITAGQVVYQDSSGEAALADASAAGTATAIGVALESKAVGEAVPILALGFVTGFDLSSVSYDTLLSVSDTAGDIDNGAGSPTVAAPVGRCWSLGDSDATKVIFVNCLYNLNVLPA